MFDESFLHEILKRRFKNRAEFARITGIPESAVSKLLNGKMEWTSLQIRRVRATGLFTDEEIMRMFFTREGARDHGE